MFAVIGMSPGNSYFKLSVIIQLLKKALGEYGNVGVFIPDVPAIATYVALGYPENRARTDKAVAQGNALKNKVRKAIEIENLDASRIRIFEWRDEVENNPEYVKQFEYIQKLYESNPEFKNDANAATADVLEENPFRKISIGDAQIQKGVHYLLSEFAFMLFLPGFLGAEKVGYIYHKPWPPFEKLIAGGYTGEPVKNVAFIRYPEFV
jgi:cyclo(L-tyrosyl-L-tyrosyl) synthase